MSEDANELTEGSAAPEIDADVTGGSRFTLSAHRGKWVVVYFYPRANTPG